MNLRKAALAAIVTGSMLSGVVVGAAAFGANVFAASTNAPAQASGAPATASGAPARANNGKFVPNEDPAHEAGESAEREAQEDAGQVPTVP
jgi:hypothetical protein